MNVLTRSFTGCAVAIGLLGSTAHATDGMVPPFNPVADQPQCRGSAGYAQDFGGRQVYLWRPQWLEAIADRAASDKGFRKDIVGEAEKALGRGPYSVTDKTKPVPGAGPNDYASIGPYWWPDPKKKDGLPYIRRDGEVNPERDGPEFDKDRLRSMAKDLKAVALAYYITGEDRFAQHGSKLLRTWYLDPATRMAPNLNFAQGIPGQVNGRGEGIIESSDLATSVESAGLIWSSGALSDEEKSSLRKWHAEFVQWMATSPNGEDEMRKRNNHGVFYDFYLAYFALFAGLPSVTKSVVGNFPQYRLAQQMDRQGRFIEELKRTRSWHYSIFVVDAATRLATIGECTGQDLWAAKLEDGRDLTVARAFLDKHASNLSAWPFPDIDKQAGKIEKMRAEYEDIAQLFGRGAVPTGEVDLP